MKVFVFLFGNLQEKNFLFWNCFHFPIGKTQFNCLKASWIIGIQCGFFFLFFLMTWKENRGYWIFSFCCSNVSYTIRPNVNRHTRAFVVNKCHQNCRFSSVCSSQHTNKHSKQFVQVTFIRFALYKSVGIFFFVSGMFHKP